MNTDGCSNTGIINPTWYCLGPIGVADVCEQYCGDGKDYYGLATRCDDGNNLPNDGCSPNCYTETGFKCTFSTTGALSVCTEPCGDGVNLGTV